MYFESRRSSNSIHRSDQSELFEMGLSSRTFQSLMRSFSLVQSSDCRRCLGCCMKKRTSSCSNACKRKVLIGSFVAVVVGRCRFRRCGRWLSQCIVLPTALSILPLKQTGGERTGGTSSNGSHTDGRHRHSDEIEILRSTPHRSTQLATHS